MTIAEVRKFNGEWRVTISDAMGSAGLSKSRKATLTYFRDRMSPTYSRAVLLIIYTDLDHIDQVWCFRRGKGIRLKLNSWLRPWPGKGG